MKILKRLIKLHKFLSMTAILFSFLPVILNLCWNNFLVKLIDIFGYAAADDPENRTRVLFTFLPTGIFIILSLSVSEYLSSCLASFTCEMFAHEMRIGYAGYFLQSDIRMLSKLNVGERGNQVSGGQAQRIQIARALCKNAPVILLDEPVSALDKDTGYSVLNTLKQLTDGKTVIHVTHHQETLDKSYTLYHMEGGKLIHE